MASNSCRRRSSSWRSCCGSLCGTAVAGGGGACAATGPAADTRQDKTASRHTVILLKRYLSNTRPPGRNSQYEPVASRDRSAATSWICREWLEDGRSAGRDAIGAWITQTARDERTETAVGLSGDGRQGASTTCRLDRPEPMADGAVLLVVGTADGRKDVLGLVVRLSGSRGADLVVHGAMRHLPHRDEQNDGGDSARRAAKPSQDHERSD